MYNSKIYLLGLEVFLNENKALSKQLKEAVWTIRKELRDIDTQLVQFAVNPNTENSVVSFNIVRERALLDIVITDDAEWIEANKKFFKITEYKQGDILYLAATIAKEKFEYSSCQQITRESLPEIIQDFNRRFGFYFYDPSSEKEKLSMEDYIKLQKIKNITRQFLDDKNISGISAAHDKIIFYMAKKMSQKAIEKNYPLEIEGVSITFKYAGKFAAVSN